MLDREKVIEGLIRCLHFDGTCNDCPYDGPNCQNDVLDDVIALLKEQPEVVRCKDCVHQCNRRIGVYRMFIECKKTGSVHHETWFCADGERR